MGVIDLDRVERGVLLAIVIPIVAIGVYPNPVLRRVEPAVLELLYQMDRRSLAGEAAEAKDRADGDLAAISLRPDRAVSSGAAQ